jgi:hypothetical protein
LVVTRSDSAGRKNISAKAMQDALHKVNAVRCGFLGKRRNANELRARATVRAYPKLGAVSLWHICCAAYQIGKASSQARSFFVAKFRPAILLDCHGREIAV